MKNLFNSFYSIVLLALCLIAFSNCSDSDDGEISVTTDNGITAIGTGNGKRRLLFMERLLKFRLRLLENGLLLYKILQEQIGLL